MPDISKSFTKCRVKEGKSQNISLGGLHDIATKEIRKIAAALARHTGEDEGQTVAHLFTRCAILIQRGLAALLVNRIPEYPPVAISGDL